MTSQIYWLFFMALTVLGSVGYNVAVKSAGEQVNVFVFTVTLTAVAFVGHLVAFLIYKYNFHGGEKLEINSMGIWMAVLAGISVVIIDLGFFLSVKSGGMVVSQAVWTIGSLLFVVIVGLYFFKEGLDLYKLIGVILGVVSLGLLVNLFKHYKFKELIPV